VDSLGFNTNTLVDYVLRTVYEAPTRRKVVFSSPNPNICAALNWKQPNCKWLQTRENSHKLTCYSDPVFFVSHCGLSPQASTSPPALTGYVGSIDFNCASVEAAIDFSQSNNLLGLMINGLLLVRHTYSTSLSNVLIMQLDRTTYLHSSNSLKNRTCY
jgi:CDK inhibitor PHO81